MRRRKTAGTGLDRREFLATTSKYAALVALTAAPGSPIFEMAAAYAATESEKKAKAEHVLLFGSTETLHKWPHGKLSHEQSNLTGMLQLKQYIEEETKGKVYVDMQFGGTLGNQIEMPRKLQQGVLAGCHASTQNAAAAAPVWNVIDFPYHVGPVDGFWKILFSKDANDTLRKKSEAQGLVTLTVFPQIRWIELRKNLGKQVRKPEDLKGLKIRVTGSKLEQVAFHILPSNATPVAWGEVYNAMKSGAVDGIHVGPAPVADVGISDVVGTQTNTEFMYNSDGTFLSTKWFRALPGALQEAILEGAYRAQVYQHKKFLPFLRDQWGIYPDSPPDSLYKKLKIDTVFLSKDERAHWVDFLSYKRNKDTYDPLIKRFGKTEYETVGRVAAAAGPVEPHRWWKTA